MECFQKGRQRQGSFHHFLPEEQPQLAHQEISQHSVLTKPIQAHVPCLFWRAVLLGLMQCVVWYNCCHANLSSWNYVCILPNWFHNYVVVIKGSIKGIMASWIMFRDNISLSEWNTILFMYCVWVTADGGGGWRSYKVQECFTRMQEAKKVLLLQLGKNRDFI